MSLTLVCPTCKIPLRQVFGATGLFWVCPQCSGRAATLPVLRKVLPTLMLNKLWRTTCDGAHPTSPQHCPSCHCSMVEVPAECGEAHGGTVFLDICKNCHILWFDADEFGQFPKRIPEIDVNDEKTLYTGLPSGARERVLEAQVKAIQQQACTQGDASKPDLEWRWIVGLLGLPVECDQQSLTRRPWVIWSVALACVAAMAISMDDLRGTIDAFGFIPAEPFRKGGLTLLTSLFLHGGWGHLLGNLYFLIMFGDNVEEELGYAKLLFLLFLAALLGAGLHYLDDPSSTIPCVGASGAISGILVFYALFNPHARIQFMLRPFFIAFGWVTMKASTFMGIWVLLQVLEAHLLRLGISNVSGMAHLGGAVAGFTFWLVWRLPAPPKITRKSKEHTEYSRDYRSP